MDGHQREPSCSYCPVVRAPPDLGPTRRGCYQQPAEGKGKRRPPPGLRGVERGVAKKKRGWLTAPAAVSVVVEAAKHSHFRLFFFSADHFFTDPYYWPFFFLLPLREEYQFQRLLKVSKSEVVQVIS